MPIMIQRLDWLPKVGDRVQCAGSLYVGTGTVKEVRIPDAALYAVQNGVKNSGEPFPHIVVKPDTTWGSRLTKGDKSLIRYHADDIRANKVMPYVTPPTPVFAAAAAPTRAAFPTLRNALRANNWSLSPGKMGLLAPWLDVTPTSIEVNGSIVATFGADAIITIDEDGVVEFG